MLPSLQEHGLLAAGLCFLRSSEMSSPLTGRAPRRDAGSWPCSLLSSGRHLSTDTRREGNGASGGQRLSQIPSGAALDLCFAHKQGLDASP